MTMVNIKNASWHWSDLWNVILHSHHKMAIYYVESIMDNLPTWLFFNHCNATSLKYSSRHKYSNHSKIVPLGTLYKCWNIQLWQSLLHQESIILKYLDYLLKHYDATPDSEWGNNTNKCMYHNIKMKLDAKVFLQGTK